MHEIETAIRLIVIGQELLIALIFLFGTGSKSARISGALLLVSVAAYLYTSDPTLRELVPSLLPATMLLSIAVPYFLWTFAKCVFDSPLPAPWLIILFVAVGLAVWIAFMASTHLEDAWYDSTYVLIRVVSLVIVINTVWTAASGRPDDLLERRRRFRMIFVILVSIQVTAVLIVELVYGRPGPPGWMTLLNVVVIGGLTMGLAVLLLQLNAEFFPIRSGSRGAAPKGVPEALSAAERVLRDKLMASMEAGSYRKTSLTIATLASDLNFPEHQLRRLINRHLGFRNFSAFLNSYRIGEAKDRLADPEYARTPVLTIALDLGYGSLGPFNRAFKAMTDMTPTEFREQAIPAVSE